MRMQWRQTLTLPNFSSLQRKIKVSLQLVKKWRIVSEQSLGVTIDNKLNFNGHVNKLYNKASQKLNALALVSSYMSIENR